MKLKKKLIAAGAAMLLSGVLQAADNHTITVNATVAGNCKFDAATSSVDLTLDPTASGVVSGNAAVLYRCTKGTAPVFGFTSASTGSDSAGTLDGSGSDSIPYTFTTTSGGPGSGFAPGNEKTLTVTVSVDQANAASVAADTYSDTIAITLNP